MRYSFQDSRPFVTLSELSPGKYVDVLAKVMFLRTVERTDSKKMIFSGVLKDSTYKVPFISHPSAFRHLQKNDCEKYHSFLMWCQLSISHDNKH
jgi:hypothetical protein